MYRDAWNNQNKVLSGVSELEDIQKNLDFLTQSLNRLPSGEARRYAIYETREQVIQDKKKLVNTMKFDQSTLKDMSKYDLDRETKKTKSILNMLHPHEDFPEQVAAAKQHLENIEQYQQQHKVWELIGVDNDDSNSAE